MEQRAIDTIVSRFAPVAGVPCWVICNPDKQPCTIHAGRYESEPVRNYRMGDLLRWKSEPQDNITTLDRAMAAARMLPGYSVGPILGMNNTLGCYDFDHCLDSNGNIINEHLREFLSLIMSYTEVSASGRGLHVFVLCSQVEPEYGFSPDFIGDGKFYSSRFIKLTGNIYREHDYPIKAIGHHELDIYRRQLEHIKPVLHRTTPHNAVYKNDQSWGEILESAGIIHQPATEHIGKVRRYPDGSERVVIESFRILCPNYLHHTDHQRRNKAVCSGGGDVAILSRFDDGLSSVKCCHNNCDPKKHNVNLLQMLWVQIKQNRAVIARDTLKSLGVAV